MPSAGEVEGALRVLRRYAGTPVDQEGLETEQAGTKRPTPSRRVAVPQQVPKSVTSAKTAIKGTVSDTTGETYGVVGISNSPNGAGVAAANTNGGADLVIDGLEDGQPDAVFTQAGIDRASPTEQWFFLINSDTGVLSLNVEGTIVGDGSGLTAVDADTLDGTEGSDFATYVEAAGLVAVHAASAGHDGRYFTETELGTSGGGTVHWGNLTTVPAGLDDGDDDTLYSAGTGLQLVGHEFRAIRTGYSNVVVVASSGGDYTSIQAAIDSITDASASNPYLVWVAPGVYTEQVAMKSHVHLRGAGQEATVITSNVGNTTWPPDQPTVGLASDVSLRDLSILNTGAGPSDTALVASGGTERALVADVTATTQGAGGHNYTIVLIGPGTDIAVDRVTAIAEGGSGVNGAFRVAEDVVVTLNGGSFTGRGGAETYGIQTYGGVGRLIGTNVTALGETGSSVNAGFRSRGGALVTLHGGEFLGSGGSTAYGIVNHMSGTSLVASDVVAAAESGSVQNIGLDNQDGIASLRGGEFTGEGGDFAIGINSRAFGTVDAAGVMAIGVGGVNNYGLYSHEINVTTILTGGTFIGRGGTHAFGIENVDSGSVVRGLGVTVIAEDASEWNYGLINFATAMFHGSSFAARGGDYSWGIDNLGELDFTGGKTTGESAVLESVGFQQRGASSARIGATQIAGGMGSLSGTVTCFQVFDETYTALSCTP